MTCPRCSDTGWEHVWILLTRKGADKFAARETERIPREPGESLMDFRRRLSAIGTRLSTNQEIVSAVERCTHGGKP